MSFSGNHEVPLPANFKNEKDMEVVSIERSTYEELLMSFNSFVTKMKEMASRGNDKGLRFGNLTPSPILPNLLFDQN